VEYVVNSDPKWIGTPINRVTYVLDQTKAIPWSPSCPVDPVVSEVIHRLGRLNWSIDNEIKPDLRKECVRVPSPKGSMRFNGRQQSHNGVGQRASPKGVNRNQHDPSGTGKKKHRRMASYPVEQGYEARVDHRKFHNKAHRPSSINGSSNTKNLIYV